MNDKQREKWFEQAFKEIFTGTPVVPYTNPTEEEMRKYYGDKRLDKPKPLNYK